MVSINAWLVKRWSRAVRVFALTSVACLPSPRGATPGADAHEQLRFERRACFGTCPVYVVTAASNGAMTFDGRAHVDSIGRFAGRLDASRHRALAAVLNAPELSRDHRYAYGEPGCTPYMADAPTIIVTITSESGTRTVEHDGGCTNAPARLTQLERQIDDILETSRWTGRASAPGR